jgi:hypothetical protein
MDEIKTILAEAIAEGIFDVVRGLVGKKVPTQFQLIPKEQWEGLMRDDSRLVSLLANTPEIRDAAGVAADVLERLNSLESKKIQQVIRTHGRRIKDPNASRDDKQESLRQIRDVIVGLRNEADKMRAVRGSIKPRYEQLELKLNKVLGINEQKDAPKPIKPDGIKKKSAAGAHRFDDGVEYTQIEHDELFRNASIKNLGY